MVALRTRFQVSELRQIKLLHYEILLDKIEILEFRLLEISQENYI